MTQREYIAASLKIIGLAVLISGAAMLSRNLLGGGCSYYQSKQASITCAGDLPAEVKMEADDQNRSISLRNQLASLMYLSRIPANILVIVFGLVLIKKEHWFTAFLIGRQKDVQPSV